MGFLMHRGSCGDRWDWDAVVAASDLAILFLADGGHGRNSLHLRRVLSLLKEGRRGLLEVRLVVDLGRTEMRVFTRRRLAALWCRQRLVVHRSGIGIVVRCHGFTVNGSGSDTCVLARSS